MLSDLQKDKLQRILGDNVLLNAIWQIFMETLEANRPIIGQLEDNALIGEKYRAYEVARVILQAGFQNMKSYEDNKINKKTFNKER